MRFEPPVLTPATWATRRKTAEPLSRLVMLLRSAEYDVHTGEIESTA
jgi:hypothetical protein